MKNITSLFLFFVGATGMLSATTIPIVKAEVLNVGQTLVNNGRDISPFTLSVNGTKYAALSIDVRDCFTIGTTYSAYETQLSGNNFSDTYHPTFSTQYKEEAYLLNLILKPNADRVEIQNAAWALMDSSYKVDAKATSYMQLAAANYKSLDMSLYDLISGTDCNRPTEFIIDPSASTATPEPASMLLMGGGLLVAGLVRRKAAKKS